MSRNFWPKAASGSHLDFRVGVSAAAATPLPERRSDASSHSDAMNPPLTLSLRLKVPAPW